MSSPSPTASTTASFVAAIARRCARSTRRPSSILAPSPRISSVSAGTPAAKAGLKAGDVITALDGKAITKADDLTAGITAHAPNDKVTLTITRNGKTLQIDVTLGVRPS